MWRELEKKEDWRVKVVTAEVAEVRKGRNGEKKLWAWVATESP